MVLVVAAPLGPQFLVVLHELDFDLLEPEFVLAAEAERCAVIDIERLPVQDPEQRTGEMPPARKTPGMPDPGQAEPVRNRHTVVLRRVVRHLRNWVLNRNHSVPGVQWTFQ